MPIPSPLHHLGTFALGGVLWTLVEYALHRGLGHRKPGRIQFTREHVRHHAVPGYFAPARDKARAALFAVALVFVIAAWIGGWLAAVLFTSGFLATYLAYEVLHRRAHTHPPRGRYTRWARRHHFYHHFQNPKVNHGVTTPVWDLVFRTYVRPEKVRVPGRHAMDWLTEPATGKVRAAYAGDYEVFRPKARQPLPLPWEDDTPSPRPSGLPPLGEANRCERAAKAASASTPPPSSVPAPYPASQADLRRLTLDRPPPAPV